MLAGEDLNILIFKALILALTICIFPDPPNLYGVFFGDPLFLIFFFVKRHQEKDVRWVILTTNIWKRQYSDPSNLDPFSGETHETYRSVTGFNISLFEGTLHVGKTHVCFKIANTRHALPFHASSLQTDLAPKRVVVSRLHQLLHDTVARFRTGRGELTPG